MRIHVVIDDQLLRDTLRVTELKTKQEAVELRLRHRSHGSGISKYNRAL